jgi:hypothetical protein
MTRDGEAGSTETTAFVIQAGTFWKGCAPSQILLVLLLNLAGMTAVETGEPRQIGHARKFGGAIFKEAVVSHGGSSYAVRITITGTGRY